MSRKAMTMALQALVAHDNYLGSLDFSEEISALQQALMEDAFGASAVTKPEYVAEQKEKTQRVLDLMAENARELGLDYDNSVVGTKTWFDGEKVVTQELKHSDVYKQPADEPVACGYDETTGNCTQVNCCYTRPQPAAWVGLTDEEIQDSVRLGTISHNRHRYSIRGQQITPADDPLWHIARAIEQALKEKNNG